MTQPVLTAPDREQLEAVVRLTEGVLGPDLHGAYLFGSALLGGLKAESDLDVLVVARRPTTRAEKRRLADGLLARSGARTPAGRRRRIELTIVVRSDVVPWRYPPRFDFQYGDWWRSEFERGDVEPWSTAANPDVTVLIAMVLRADASLLGPPPAAVLAPVPHRDLVRALGDVVDPLLADLEPDTRNVVLTLARAWSTVETGEIRSKDAAAAWALPLLPEEHRPVLVRAAAIYLGEAEERWDDLAPGVRPLAEHLAKRIGELLAAEATTEREDPPRTAGQESARAG